MQIVAMVEVDTTVAVHAADVDKLEDMAVVLYRVGTKVPPRVL